MPLLLFIYWKNSKDENDLLHKYAESIIISVKSEERLLMKRHFSASYNKQPTKIQTKKITAYTIRMLYFMPKNTLLVDDDMRNILRYQNFTRT
jgi:hypothetical protein